MIYKLLDIVQKFRNFLDFIKNVLQNFSIESYVSYLICYE